MQSRDRDGVMPIEAGARLAISLARLPSAACSREHARAWACFPGVGYGRCLRTSLCGSMSLIQSAPQWIVANAAIPCVRADGVRFARFLRALIRSAASRFVV